MASGNNVPTRASARELRNQLLVGDPTRLYRRIKVCTESPLKSKVLFVPAACDVSQADSDARSASPMVQGPGQAKKQNELSPRARRLTHRISPDKLMQRVSRKAEPSQSPPRTNSQGAVEQDTVEVGKISPSPVDSHRRDRTSQRKTQETVSREPLTTQLGKQVQGGNDQASPSTPSTPHRHRPPPSKTIGSPRLSLDQWGIAHRSHQKHQSVNGPRASSPNHLNSGQERNQNTAQASSSGSKPEKSCSRVTETDNTPPNTECNCSPEIKSKDELKGETVEAGLEAAFQPDSEGEMASSVPNAAAVEQAETVVRDLQQQQQQQQKHETVNQITQTDDCLLSLGTTAFTISSALAPLNAQPYSQLAPAEGLEHEKNQQTEAQAEVKSQHHSQQDSHGLPPLDGPPLKLDLVDSILDLMMIRAEKMKNGYPVDYEVQLLDIDTRMDLLQGQTPAMASVDLTEKKNKSSDPLKTKDKLDVG